jgi:CheY-like chemotaxis protein
MAETVMVVEDDALIREMVMQVLALEGFTTVGASNGAEALKHLKQARVAPSLILLDLMMPVMNGWQFRARQLEDPALAGIPVIVMSASDERDLPADAHVGKPFEIDELLEAISRLARASTMLH